MKTKELIRQLQEADPTGETEVCVGNVDIHFVQRLPAYYDGTLQVLERDPTTKYYNIIGGKYKRSGDKVNIHTLSISDAISNSPQDFVVDYSELPADRAESTKKAHDDLREWHKRLGNQLEWENFLKWVNQKVTVADTEDVESVARNFFDKNITADDPLPVGGVPLGKSYVNTRFDQWDATIEVAVEEGFLKISKNNAQAIPSLLPS